MDILAGGNLALNIIFALSLKFLWGFVNMLQFLVFMQLWDIDLPPNAQAVLKFLKSIALMEFIRQHKSQGLSLGGLVSTQLTNQTSSIKTVSCL